MSLLLSVPAIGDMSVGIIIIIIFLVNPFVRFRKLSSRLHEHACATYRLV